MPVYRYSAVSADGKTERGMLNESSMEAVWRRLSEKGLTVQEVTEEESQQTTNQAPHQAPYGATTHDPGFSSQPQSGPQQRSTFVTDVVGPVVGQVPLDALHMYFRQLSTMLEAGLSQNQALATLSGQTSSGKLAKISREAQVHVTEGKTLSTALEHYPEVFSPLMLSMVRMGEQNGMLGQQCNQLANYIHQDIELRRIIRKETFQPKLVIGASIVIIGAAQLFISSLGKESNLDAPLNRLGTWFVLIPILVAIFLFVRIGLKRPEIKEKWDNFLLAIPYVSGMVRGFAMAKFGRAMGALYRAGVPLADSIRHSADVMGNIAMQKRLHNVAARVQEGDSIHEVFTQAGVFDRVVLDMTKTGEMTGNLDQMLQHVAEYHESEGAVKAKQSAMFLGVIAFLAVAVYVLFILLRFYTGYFGGFQEYLN